MTVRRVKAYTGQTGFVYQYYFVGSRPATDEGLEQATEYIFDVTNDRHTVYAVSIVVRHDAVTAWASAHGRELNQTERYASAKMRLMQVFDEVKDLAGSERRFLVDPANIEELLEPLGLD